MHKTGRCETHRTHCNRHAQWMLPVANGEVDEQEAGESGSSADDAVVLEDGTPSGEGGHRLSRRLCSACRKAKVPHIA